ncbi:MAG: EAL domain-containing protein [Sulfurimonas sp.]|uniref:EAL domain-containing protein n=1 Tax=Sulfurimonas sp. TaxID=2022749 RepID=UPI0025EE5CB2|nr:EAL domain-containing protein [Sulfurimonas sp.]MCK9490855.1 EAL domain-containing protein [Sulfurimonas sp.]
MNKENLTKDIKLLYVEDNSELREETLEILEYYFQDIVVAKNGEEGLELYQKEFEKFDIVLSDIEMPKMDGVLMCKKIKEIKQDQIVVLLSAYDTKEHLKEAINLGVDKFIVKPVVDAYDFISSLVTLSEKALLKIEYKKKDFLLEQKTKIINENIFMTVSNLDGEITEISKAYLDFTGFKKEEVIGKNHSIFRNKSAGEKIIKDLWSTILKDKVWVGELKNNKATNEEYWINTTISPLYDYHHQKVGYTAIVQDITNAKRLESLFITDGVTEIENKKNEDQFTESVKNLGAMIELPSREALIKDLSLLQEDAMLILLHINQINSIKDLYGMQTVSKIVLQKSKQLSQVIIDKDVTLYCLNIQEFAILVRSKTLFEKYMELLKYSILTNSYEDNYYTEDENSSITEFTAGVSYGMLNVFNQADIALQDAIMSKKNLFVYNNNQSTLELQKTTLKRLKIYKKALNEGNVVPYFQPIIDVKNNSVMKYEALARLVLDNGEVVSPCHFLDSSKQDNTFEFFSRQMIQKVFNVYAKKKANISINIAYENINSPTMREYIKNRLDKYGGDGITFEIVESEDIEDYDLIEDFIKMVKSYKCKISIDDFGSGYSNFTNIIKLDIDYIKLDGSLIEKINIDKNVEHMVVALIEFVRNAKIKTIAEFVSTKELDAKVRELGVDYIQGYLYGEPNSAESYGLI